MSLDPAWLESTVSGLLPREGKEWRLELATHEDKVAAELTPGGDLFVNLGFGLPPRSSASS